MATCQCFEYVNAKSVGNVACSPKQPEIPVNFMLQVPVFKISVLTLGELFVNKPTIWYTLGLTIVDITQLVSSVE